MKRYCIVGVIFDVPSLLRPRARPAAKSSFPPELGFISKSGLHYLEITCLDIRTNLGNEMILNRIEF